MQCDSFDEFPRNNADNMFVHVWAGVDGRGMATRAAPRLELDQSVWVGNPTPSHG